MCPGTIIIGKYQAQSKTEDKNIIIGVRTLTLGDLGNNRSQTKMSNANFPDILTPFPTHYDYSSPRYDQKHVFDLSVTYHLDLWPKILKIILHDVDFTFNIYVKF